MDPLSARFMFSVQKVRENVFYGRNIPDINAVGYEVTEDQVCCNDQENLLLEIRLNTI